MEPTLKETSNRFLSQLASPENALPSQPMLPSHLPFSGHPYVPTSGPSYFLLCAILIFFFHIPASRPCLISHEREEPQAQRSSSRTRAYRGFFFVLNPSFYSAGMIQAIDAVAVQHYEYVGCGMELPARGILEVRYEGV
ncbi:hypothetical protein V8E52_006208 [Russula decolorans]